MRREQSSADTMIISIFGGFAVVHWPFAPLKLYNKYWRDLFLQGETTNNWQNSVVGNNFKAIERTLRNNKKMWCLPTTNRLHRPPLGPSRLKTEMGLMGLCVGSMQVSVNIVFSQTHCHKQKKVINQLRHRHRRSCAFHQSRKQNRENICTQVQLSATQAASCSTG